MLYVLHNTPSYDRYIKFGDESMVRYRKIILHISLIENRSLKRQDIGSSFQT